MGAFHSTVSGSLMKFDPAPVLKVKEELRKQLAAKPVAEKLRILDELRAASVALRAAGQELRRSEPLDSEARALFCGPAIPHHRRPGTPACSTRRSCWRGRVRPTRIRSHAPRAIWQSYSRRKRRQRAPPNWCADARGRRRRGIRATGDRPSRRRPLAERESIRLRSALLFDTSNI